MRKERFAEHPERQSSRSKILVAGLLVIVIVLSSFSVFYFAQASDYHDAKYRAQWVLMDNILDLTSESAMELDGVSGHAMLTIPYRAIWAGQLQASLNAIAQNSWSIREMYLNDREKNETFSLLQKAMTTILGNLDPLEFGLWNNVTQDIPYSENISLNAALHSAAGMISALHTSFLQAFKVDPQEDAGRSWERSPYSLVDRLNLLNVRSSCTDIMSLF